MKYIYISLLCLIALSGNSQPWKVEYPFYDEYAGYVSYPVETYDKGIVFVSHNNYNHRRIIHINKISCDGDLLWQKSIYNPGIGEDFIQLRTTKDGGFVISGNANQFDEGDAFVMKLNACGEKEWEIILQDSGNAMYPLMQNDGYNVLELDNGNFLLVTYGNFVNSMSYIVLDPQGHYLSHFTIDTQGQRILNKSKNGDLIGGGDCYTHEYDSLGNPVDTNTNWKREAVIRLNKDGSFKWFKPFGVEKNLVYLTPAACEQSNGSIYTCGADVNFNGWPVYLGKFDADGNNQWHKVIGLTDIPKYFEQINAIAPINDTTMFIASWVSYNNPKVNEYRGKVTSVNNEGKVLDSFVIGSDSKRYGFWGLAKTYDGNMIVAGQTFGPEYDKVHPILMKMDAKLNIVNKSGKVYKYDSLCGHAITNDTIHLDTTKYIKFHVDSSKIYRYVYQKNNGIVGVSLKRLQLNTYPNPVAESTTIILPALSGSGYTLSLLDMQGQELLQLPINASQQQISLSLATLRQGMYMIGLYQHGQLIAGGMVVKE
jgi:hypothetical protein